MIHTHMSLLRYMMFYILLTLFSLLLLFCSRDCGSIYKKVFVLLKSFSIDRLKSTTDAYKAPMNTTSFVS
jgi:hypothetical protein